MKQSLARALIMCLDYQSTAHPLQYNHLVQSCPPTLNPNMHARPCLLLIIPLMCKGPSARLWENTKRVKIALS